MGSLVVIEGMTFRERRSLSGSAKISKGNSFHALTTIVSTVTDALRKNYSFDSESLCVNESNCLFLLEHPLASVLMWLTWASESQAGMKLKRECHSRVFIEAIDDRVAVRASDGPQLLEPLPAVLEELDVGDGADRVVRGEFPRLVHVRLQEENIWIICRNFWEHFRQPRARRAPRRVKINNNKSTSADDLLLERVFVSLEDKDVRSCRHIRVIVLQSKKYSHVLDMVCGQRIGQQTNQISYRRLA